MLMVPTGPGRREVERHELAREYPQAGLPTSAQYNQLDVHPSNRSSLLWR